MAIQNWHVGKLIILWAWGLLVMGLSYSGMASIDKEKYQLGYLLIGVLFAVPLLLSFTTWVWLSGKETGAKKPELIVHRKNGDGESETTEFE